MSATPHTILYRSLCNFAHDFDMAWRCACALDIILELILPLFPLCELCHFLTSDSMKVYRQRLPCKRNSLYNFMPIFMQLSTSFFNGLKMCMWFGFNPALNFCHFSTLLTLYFFAGATSTSPKFDLYLLLLRLHRRSNDMTVVKSKEIVFRMPVFFISKKKQKKTEHFSKYINIKIEMNLCSGKAAKLKDLLPTERDCGLNAQLKGQNEIYVWFMFGAKII